MYVHVYIEVWDVNGGVSMTKRLCLTIINVD